MLFIISLQLWRKFTLQLRMGVAMFILFNGIKCEKLAFTFWSYLLQLFHVLWFLFGHLTDVVQSLIQILIHDTIVVIKC